MPLPPLFLLLLPLLFLLLISVTFGGEIVKTGTALPQGLADRLEQYVQQQGSVTTFPDGPDADNEDSDPKADAQSMRVRLFEAQAPAERMMRVPSEPMLPPATVDVDIVKTKTHKDSASGEREEDNAEEEEENNEVLAQMAMLGSNELRRKQSSLVPKRRRRIGTAGGQPLPLWKRNTLLADGKHKKVPKASWPTLPDSGGIDLVVQQDFVGEEQKSREESNATLATPKNKSLKEGKDGGDKGRRKLTGREFWVNALRTLLLEFKRLHPDLARGIVRKRGNNANDNKVTTDGSGRATSGSRNATESPLDHNSWRGTNRLDVLL